MLLPGIVFRIGFALDDEFEAASISFEQRVRLFDLAVSETKDVEEVKITELHHIGVRVFCKGRPRELKISRSGH